MILANKLVFLNFLSSILLLVSICAASLENKGSSPDSIKANMVENFSASVLFKFLSEGQEHHIHETIFASPQEIPSCFIVAILAVENYNRPEEIQKMENLFARSYLSIYGQLPNISLGMGQIKPETAKSALSKKNYPFDNIELQNDKQQLLNLLIDKGSNSIIVQRYLKTIMGKNGLTSFNKESAYFVLAKYNGQVAITDKGTLYQDIVWETYLRLKAKDPQFKTRC